MLISDACIDTFPDSLQSLTSLLVVERKNEGGRKLHEAQKLQKEAKSVRSRTRSGQVEPEPPRSLSTALALSSCIPTDVLAGSPLIVDGILHPSVSDAS